MLSKQICGIKKIKINAMGGKLTYVFVRGMPSFEMKIPGSVHLRKLGFFEECISKYCTLNSQLLSLYD